MELQGFVTINWAALHAWLGAKAQLLDQNGDGKLDAKDAHVIAVRPACAATGAPSTSRVARCAAGPQSRFSQVMATTAPSAAGFVAGFAFGMM